MEMDGYFRFILALVFVIGLIAILAAMARKAGWGFPATAIKRVNNRRLGIVEVTPLDGRRRLILIRRDGVEHLLLMGPTSEMLVEAGITDGASSGIESFEDAVRSASQQPESVDKPEPPA